MRTKKQKEIIDRYVDELGVIPHTCDTVAELIDAYDDIRQRVSKEDILTKKQKNDILIASRFAQSIISKKIKKNRL